MDQRLAQMRRVVQADKDNQDAWMAYLRLAAQLSGIKVTVFQLKNFFDRNKGPFIQLLEQADDLSIFDLVIQKILLEKKNKNIVILLKQLWKSRRRKRKKVLDFVSRFDNILINLKEKTKSEKIRTSINNLETFANGASKRF